MASKNSDVFATLVASNVAPLAKNKRLDELTVGQIGIFDADTNVSLDTTNLTGVNKFYLAVGVNPADFKGRVYLKSQGNGIARNAIADYAAVCYKTHKEKIVQITNLKAECDKEYTVSIQVRSNELTRFYGQNFPRITYSVRTACCADCASCSDATSGNDLANKIVTEINADKNPLVVASLWDATNGVAITNLADWITSNPTLTASVRITGIYSAQQGYVYGLINGIQDTPFGVSFDVSLNEGFGCSGTTSVIQDMAFERNNVNDLKRMEFVSHGQLNGGAFNRQSASGAIYDTIPSQLTHGNKYNLITIGYNDNHTGGLGNYSDWMYTNIILPCGGNSAFLATLDALVATSGVSAIASVISGCDCNA